MIYIYIWYIQAFLKIGVPLFSIGFPFEKCQQIHCMITRFVSRKPPSYRSYPPFTSLEPMFPAIEPIWAVFKLLSCPFITGWLMARFLYEWIVNMHPIYKKNTHTHTYTHIPIYNYIYIYIIFINHHHHHHDIYIYISLSLTIIINQPEFWTLPQCSTGPTIQWSDASDGSHPDLHESLCHKAGPAAAAPGTAKEHVMNNEGWH
jgi:hypothetical protein